MLGGGGTDFPMILAWYSSTRAKLRRKHRKAGKPHLSRRRGLGAWSGWAPGGGIAAGPQADEREPPALVGDTAALRAPTPQPLFGVCVGAVGPRTEQPRVREKVSACRRTKAFQSCSSTAIRDFVRLICRGPPTTTWDGEHTSLMKKTIQKT